MSSKKHLLWSSFSNEEQEIGSHESKDDCEQFNLLVEVILVMNVVLRQMMVVVGSVDFGVAVHLGQYMDCGHVQKGACRY